MINFAFKSTILKNSLWGFIFFISALLFLLHKPGNAQIDLNNGLVAYWSFDDGTATDNSGNGHNGAINGNPLYVAGVKGKALRFDGIDDYVEIPAHAGLDNLDFTICFWVNRDGYGINNIGSIIDRAWQGKNSSTIADVLTVFVNDVSIRDDRLRVYYNWDGQPPFPTSEYFLSTKVIADSVSYFICIAKQDRILRIYEKGLRTDEFVLPANVNPYVHSGNWYLGTQIDNGSIVSAFKGIFDEIRMYNRALNETEIQALYQSITSVEDSEKSTEAPAKPSLFANYPNPFNSSTIILYQLPQVGDVEIVIYNLLGGKIRTLVKQEQPPGYYRVLWNGRDENGTAVSSGIYLYRLKSEDYVQTRKMILVQ